MERFSCKTMIISGPGAISALGDLGSKRLFLVTDPFFAKNGTAQRIAAAAKAFFSPSSVHTALPGAEGAVCVGHKIIL